MGKLPERRRSTMEITLNVARILTLRLISKIYEKIRDVCYLVYYLADYVFYQVLCLLYQVYYLADEIFYQVLCLANEIFYQVLCLADDILYLSIRMLFVSILFYLDKEQQLLNNLSDKRARFSEIIWIILMIWGFLFLRKRKKKQLFFALDEQRRRFVELQTARDFEKFELLKYIPRFRDSTANGIYITPRFVVLDKYGLLKSVTYINDVDFEKEEKKFMFRKLQMEKDLKKLKLLSFVPRFVDANTNAIHFTPIVKIVNKPDIWKSITSINDVEKISSNSLKEDTDIYSLINVERLSEENTTIYSLVNIEQLRDKHGRPFYDE